MSLAWAKGDIGMGSIQEAFRSGAKITRMGRIGAGHQIDARVQVSWTAAWRAELAARGVEEVDFSRFGAGDVAQLAGEAFEYVVDQTDDGGTVDPEGVRAEALPGEEWRSVVGREGRYQVSNHGRVRSLDRVVRSKATGRMRVQGRLLKRQSGPLGHKHLGLSQDGVRRTEQVARLVLTAFDRPPADGEVARFRDGDAGNPRLGNVLWGPQGLAPGSPLRRQDQPFQVIEGAEATRKTPNGPPSGSRPH